VISVNLGEVAFPDAKSAGFHVRKTMSDCEIVKMCGNHHLIGFPSGARRA
jgi:hypothetical protein